MGNDFKKNYKKLRGLELTAVTPDTLVDREDVRLFAGSAASGDYVVGSNEQKFYVLNGQSPTFVLPSNPEVWQDHVIKDNTGQAGTYPIQIFGSGITIDGESSAQINSNWGSLTIVYNGTQWNIV